MTVQRGMCNRLYMVDMKQPITKNKINIKIRYDLQDTEYRTCSVQVCKCASVQMSKWHWQLWGSYEVESNNEGVISDLK